VVFFRLTERFGLQIPTFHLLRASVCRGRQTEKRPTGTAARPRHPEAREEPAGLPPVGVPGSARAGPRQLYDSPLSAVDLDSIVGY
jgi:hypothetical protein